MPSPPSPTPTPTAGRDAAGSRHKLAMVTRQALPGRCCAPQTLSPSVPKLQVPSGHTGGSNSLLHAVMGTGRGATGRVLVALLQSKQGQLAAPVLRQTKERKVKNAFVVSLCCFPE